ALIHNINSLALWYFGVSFVVTIVKLFFFIWFIEKPVDEYLNEWGFSSVSSVFKDEGIDEEAFLLLTPEYVAKLMKGHRLAVFNIEYPEE
ncbi:hypothetical protein Avbf_17389, partial [Armadillidium vulgare]